MNGKAEFIREGRAMGSRDITRSAAWEFRSGRAVRNREVVRQRTLCTLSPRDDMTRAIHVCEAF